MPRSSVTATKVLPVASWIAVTVTPGSTPPVESETVPVRVASCACSRAGSIRIAPSRTSRPTTLDLIQPPRMRGPYYLPVLSVKNSSVLRAWLPWHNRWMAPARSSAGFNTLGLSDTLIATLTALGYEEPTPVQRETIPLMLAGRDLLAQAATGTGKTAAFALPIIQALAQESARGTRALVLVPTRELAMQVSEAIHRYARGTGLSVVPVYGGSSMQQQIRALDRGADIVVGTPGRALDHLRRKTLTLDAVRVLVLDEADEMLDMGFADDIETILHETPATRPTTLVSATMPGRDP